MKIQLALLCSLFLIYNSSQAQWEQSLGSESLDVQSLLSTGSYDFFGGQTGTYRSDDESYSFTFSNSGNDSDGPTRGFTTDGTYIYTCTSQGVFRSSDNGDSWFSKSEGLTQLLCHGLIYGNNTLYLSTLSGVFKSTDHADTWTAAGMTGIDSRSITCIQDSILFVGTQGYGVYKSVDYGNNWETVNNGLSGTNFRAIQAQGNTVFAGGQNGTGVYRSLDYGLSWDLLNNGIASSSYRGFDSNDSIIIAGSTSQGVFYSLDNGNSWAQINDGLGDLNIFDLELNNNYILAATHNDGVYRYPLSEIFSSNVSINEINNTTNAKLISIVDVLGRKSEEKPNKILFYIYEDGSVKKKLILN